MNANLKGIIALISLIAAGLGLSPFLTTQTGVVTLSPIADAGVGSTTPNQNFGSLTTTQVGADPSTTWYRYFFMMFDLSQLPGGAQITDLKLNTYCEYVGQSGYFEVTQALSNAWTETGITWNNAPGLAVGAPESPLITSAGSRQWSMEFYSTYANQQLASDKKVTFVLVPDRDSPSQKCWGNWRTKEYGGGFGPQLLVYYSYPLYTLTVSVKDTTGKPIQGASITSPFSASTDISGLASKEFQQGTYTVTVTYSGATQTQSVVLNADKTVSFSFAPPPAPPKKYTFNLIYSVADQLGHALPATISEATTYKLKDGSSPILKTSQTDSTGRVARTFAEFDDPSFSLTLTASVQVKAQTYNITKTFTVSSNTTLSIVITRRFYWTFFINYTDGSFATGTLTLTSPRETLAVSVTNGLGEAYLLDGKYSVSFSASPSISVTTLDVTNDGELEATLDKLTATTQTSSQNTISTDAANSPVSALPYYLLPSVYIYGLLGVLVFGFIIAAVVALRRKPQ